jgi:beta-lactamase regulating signal transducer with metallopeptidase domain
MPNDIDLVSFQVARLALAYLLHSTLLLGGTWLFLRAARVRSWALQDRLWKLAVILPLITAAIPLPASWPRPLARLSGERLRPQPPNFKPDITAAAAKRHPAVSVGLSSDEAASPVMVDAAHSAQSIVVPDEGRFEEAKFSAVRDTTEARTSDVEPNPANSSITAVAVAGICGTIAIFFFVGTLRVIWRSSVFGRSLRDCQPIRSGPICDVLGDVLRKANVRRHVRLLVSGASRQPAAFGVFRWTIVLPQDLVPTLETDELRALLGHEMAHLVRGDAIWLWIGRVLCACFAFQPLNFVARTKLRLAAEFLCDEWAVRHAAGRFALARCLTRVAEWTAAFPPRAAELAAVGVRSSLSERVESLILERPPAESWNTGGRRLVVWMVALAIACGLECCAPRTVLLAEPPSRASRAGIPGSAEPARINSRPIRADAFDSLDQETRALLSELERVESLLKRTTPPDPALDAIAVRLESRAAMLVNDRARLQNASHVVEPRHFNRSL